LKTDLAKATAKQTLKKPQADPEQTTGNKAYANLIKPKTNHKEAANEA
jgi:hypothetical protein